MKLRHKLLSLFLLLIPALPAAASGVGQLQFRSYTIDHGLPVGTVWCACQDSCGFLWFGTENGLVRFDGLAFATYGSAGDGEGRHSGSKVYDIAQAPGGRLFAATNGGVTLFDITTGRFTPLTPADGQPLGAVRALWPEGDTTLLAGTEGRGLLRIDLATLQVAPIALRGLGTNYIRSISRCANGNLYVGTNGAGVFEITPRGVVTPMGVSDEASGTRVNRVVDHPSGQLLACTERGLFAIDKRLCSFSEIPLAGPGGKPMSPQIRAAQWDRGGNLWLATYAGLLLCPKGDLQAARLVTSTPDNEYGLSSNRLLDLALDAGGSLWITNFDNGINVLHGTDVPFRLVSADGAPDGLPSNIVMSFAKSAQGQILVGTVGKGLSLFDVGAGTFRNYNAASRKLNDRVLAIYQESPASLWLGSWGEGLQNYNPATGQVRTFRRGDLSSNTVLCLRRDGDHLLIGTYNGLNRINLSTKEIERYDTVSALAGAVVNAIAPMDDGRLLLATNNRGCLLFDPAAGRVDGELLDADGRPVSPANASAHTAIRDRQGRLWIGTALGITVLDPATGKTTAVNERNGLSNNMVWGIVEDADGDFWISSNRGITKYNHNFQLDNPLAYRVIGLKDGLRCLEFSQGAYLLDSATNTVYFGGPKGFYHFEPRLIKPRVFEPQIQLTSLKVMDMEWNADTSLYCLRHLEVPYDKNFLSFEFASLDYYDPANNLYQYMLEGQSSKWSEPTRRNYITFSDLKDGDYTLRIRGTNSDGVWSGKERVLEVVVRPPWWRTRTALVLYAAALIMSVLGISRWRTIRFERERRVLEAVVTERTRELNQKNLDITSSIQYAKRIQQAIIQPKIMDFVEEFAQSFVIFRPKDIVSGDFFWCGHKDGKFFFAAADCTGHGVPGAFMSIVCTNLLERAVVYFDSPTPSQILEYVDQNLMLVLNHHRRKDYTFDGMDIALCCYDPAARHLTHSGACRPLALVRDGEITQYKAVRLSIGGSSQLKAKKGFTDNEIDIVDGDSIYCYSDGITDQFGGPTGRKFSNARLNQLLVDVSNLPFAQREPALTAAIDQWRGTTEQTDDVIVVGVRFGGQERQNPAD